MTHVALIPRTREGAGSRRLLVLLLWLWCGVVLFEMRYARWGGPTLAGAASSSTGPTPTVDQVVGNGVAESAYALFQFYRLQYLNDPAYRGVFQVDPARHGQIESLGDQAEELSQQLQRLPLGVRPEKLRTVFVPEARRLERSLKMLITADQLGQVDRFVLQGYRGALVYLFPGVPEALHLTDEQRREIEQIIQETIEATDWEHVDRPVEQVKLALRAVRARTRANALLTREQHERWEALLGY